MLTLIPKRRHRVPDRFAILAAITLAVTMLAGVPRNEDAQAELAVQTDDTSQQAGAQAAIDDGAARKGKLNISKLLFGQG
jgi:hypothetical protein